MIIAHASKPVRKIISFDDKKTVVEFITYILTKCASGVAGGVAEAYASQAQRFGRRLRCAVAPHRYKALFPVDVRPENYGLVIPGAPSPYPTQCPSRTAAAVASGSVPGIELGWGGVPCWALDEMGASGSYSASGSVAGLETGEYCGTSAVQCKRAIAGSDVELDREMQLSIHDHFEKRKTQAGGPFSLPRYASLPAPSHKVGRVCFRWLRRNVSFAVGIGASAVAVQEHPALVHMVLRSEVCPCIVG